MGYVGDLLSEGKQQPVARCDSKGWRQEERCGLESLAVGASQFDQLALVVAGLDSIVAGYCASRLAGLERFPGADLDYLESLHGSATGFKLRYQR